MDGVIQHTASLLRRMLYVHTVHRVSEKRGEQLQHFINLYVSYGTTAGFLRGGEKYYTYFAANSLLFPTVEDYSKLVNS